MGQIFTLLGDEGNIKKVVKFVGSIKFMPLFFCTAPPFSWSTFTFFLPTSLSSSVSHKICSKNFRSPSNHKFNDLIFSSTTLNLTFSSSSSSPHDGGGLFKRLIFQGFPIPLKDDVTFANLLASKSRGENLVAKHFRHVGDESSRRVGCFLASNDFQPDPVALEGRVMRVSPQQVAPHWE